MIYDMVCVFILCRLYSHLFIWNCFILRKEICRSILQVMWRNWGLPSSCYTTFWSRSMTRPLFIGPYSLALINQIEHTSTVTGSHTKTSWTLRKTENNQPVPTFFSIRQPIIIWEEIVEKILPGLLKKIYRGLENFEMSNIRVPAVNTK